MLLSLRTARKFVKPITETALDHRTSDHHREIGTTFARKLVCNTVAQWDLQIAYGLRYLDEIGRTALTSVELTDQRRIEAIRR